MDDLRKQYQRERKRARDRLYRARQKGYSFYAKDLPEIPSVITEEDIEILKDISEGVLESIKTDKELEEYDDATIAKDLAEMIAPPSATADYSIFDTLLSKITDLENRIRQSNFLGARDGYVVIGKTALPRDTDADKADIISNWENILDEVRDSPQAASDLYWHLVENEDVIAEIIYDLETITYMEAQYTINIYALESLINYQAPNIESTMVESIYDIDDYDDYEE